MVSKEESDFFKSLEARYFKLRSREDVKKFDKCLHHYLEQRMNWHGMPLVDLLVSCVINK
jgi:hypothetical protein